MLGKCKDDEDDEDDKKTDKKTDKKLMDLGVFMAVFGTNTPSD